MASITEISVACREAISKGKYLYILHDRRWRNIYPFSIRTSKKGSPRLHAWCSIHFAEKGESFLLEKIDDYKLSNDAIDRNFFFATEFK